MSMDYFTMMKINLFSRYMTEQVYYNKGLIKCQSIYEANSFYAIIMIRNGRAIDVPARNIDDVTSQIIQTFLSSFNLATNFKVFISLLLEIFYILVGVVLQYVTQLYIRERRRICHIFLLF
jgi:hypothetical protein